MDSTWKNTTKTTYKSWLTTDLFVRLHNNTMTLWQVLLCPYHPGFPISSQRLPRFGWNPVLDTHKQRKQQNYLPDLAGLSLPKQFQAFATGLQVLSSRNGWLQQLTVCRFEEQQIHAARHHHFQHYYHNCVESLGTAEQPHRRCFESYFRKRGQSSSLLSGPRSYRVGSTRDLRRTHHVYVRADGKWRTGSSLVR